MSPKPSCEELERRIEALERSNEALAREVTKYKTLFDEFPYGVTVSDAAGKILETNGVAEGMLGISREECRRRTLDGQEWRIVRVDGSDMPPDEWASVRALKEKRLVANCRMGIIKPDATVTWIEVTAAPIPVDGAGVVVVYHDVTASKSVEDELSQVFSMSLDMICIADINTATFKKVNPAFTETLGFSEEELLERPFFDFIHPDDVEGTRRVIAEKLHAGARVVNFENRYRCKDGSHRWLSWVSSPLPDRGVTFAVARDITEWKENREALERSKALLDATGRMAKVGGWELDTETREVTWTEETHRIHDVPLGERPSLATALEFFHPEDRPRLEEAIRCAVDDGVPYDLELRFVTRTGKRLWTRSIGQPVVVDGRVRVLKGTFQDITDRMEARDAVRQSEERLRAAIDKSPFPVAFVDTRDEWVRFWSQSAIKMFGHTPRNVNEWYELAYPDPSYREEIIRRWKPLLKLARESKVAVNTGEYRVTCKDGSVKICEIYAQFIPDNLIVTLNDITRRKRMEEQIVQSQKMEAIATLAGGIAHDFNNMLGVIIGNTSLALDRIGEDHELLEVLTDVQNCSMQARGLTQQLLTFSKGGAPVKEVRDINTVLRDSSGFALRGARSTCNLELADDVWPVEIDGGQITQVVNNLIINANQAMPDGGTITIRSENVTIGIEHGVPVPSGRYVLISIADTGIGIPEKHLQNVFEPYFSTKQDGSGLGLATAYSIVKKHGGYIFVTSEIEKGSTFRIYLPAFEGEAREHRVRVDSAHRGSGKILVMDDQDVILKMAERMLTGMGYEVARARDGEQAIQLYEEALSGGSPFKAVILDLTVPGGMGGLKAIGELSKIDPTIKAVVSSGYSNDPVLSSYRDHGFCGILPKPYTRTDLAETLNQIFGGHEPS